MPASVQPMPKPLAHEANDEPKAQKPATPVQGAGQCKPLSAKIGGAASYLIEANAYSREVPFVLEVWRQNYDLDPGALGPRIFTTCGCSKPL